MEHILDKILQNPVIAAVRRVEDLEKALESQVTTIFMLTGDIFNINSIVERIKTARKNTFIHIDFLDGIGRDHTAIDYIARVIKPNGIISTRSSHIKYAREMGLFTIQRFFLIDSLSFDTTIRTVNAEQPDMIEVMPAVMPKVIKKVCQTVGLPVIAGGLVDNKQDIIDVLNAGAVGVSTGKPELWSI